MAVFLDVAAGARAVIGHLVDHPAVGLREPDVVLEKIAMRVDVRDDELVIGHAVAAEEIRIAWVGVDYHLVDLVESVGIALLEPLNEKLVSR